MKTLFACLVFLLYSVVALWAYYNCNWCYTTNQETSETVYFDKATDSFIPPTGKFSNKLIVLNHASDTILTYPAGIKIIPHTDSIVLPLAFNTVVKDLKAYLKKNPATTIQIASNSAAAESTKDSILKNKRGMRLKKYFVENQINDKRIFITTNPLNQNQLLDIRLVKMDTARLKVYENSIRTKILYSKFRAHNFKPDTALIAYTKELLIYLKKYSTKSITVIGHTDAAGNNEDNVWFGKQRAKNVRNYLISQGVPEEKIIIQSKGETNPIVPNDTEANRAKNRRIEIIIN
ncbi:OmpA family protein [Aquimarina intermedia]|nr:OmpA family protein [Aquimarina intermedia]